MWHWYLFLSYRLLIFAIFLYIASIFKEREREQSYNLVMTFVELLQMPLSARYQSNHFFLRHQSDIIIIIIIIIIILAFG